jgi:hypothetical protein
MSHVQPAGVGVTTGVGAGGVGTGIGRDVGARQNGCSVGRSTH